jgi:predicted site-specific integrase-resolvase
MFLLRISTRTLQSYRDEGKLNFSQIGNKIYYKVSDVEKLLMSTHTVSIINGK